MTLLLYITKVRTHYHILFLFFTICNCHQSYARQPSGYGIGSKYSVFGSSTSLLSRCNLPAKNADVKFNANDDGIA